MTGMENGTDNSRIELYKRFAGEVSRHGPIEGFVRAMLQKRAVTGSNVKAEWQKSIISTESDKINFYTHIPFCLKKCPFCPFFSEELKGIETVSRYIETLSVRYEYFADVFAGKTFSNMYFSGGTPNILSSKDIEKLFTSIHKNYKFAEDGERTFEGSVVFANHDKLRLLKEFGINRISFGTQSLDNMIRGADGKVTQNYDLINRVVSDSLSLGFECVHLSLISGFAECTESGFLEEFGKILDAGATSISVYPMRLEGEYIEHFFGGDENKALKHIKVFNDNIIPKIIEIAHKRGYLIPDLEITKDKSRYDFYCADSQVGHKYISDNANNPSSVFGIGIGSGSKMSSGKILTRLTGFACKPEDDMYEVTYFSKKEQCLDHMARQFLQSKKISNNDIKTRFKADIIELFGAEIIKGLLDQGIFEIKGDNIIMDNNNPDERVRRLFILADDDDMKSYVDRCNPNMRQII